MGLGATWDDVVFDHAGAGQLAARLRSFADLLDSQTGHREAEAVAARQLWTGPFAEEFDTRLRTCRDDSTRLAAAMRRAATGLDELAVAASDEQVRRDEARSWQRQQDARSNAEKFGDALHGVVFGVDLPEPSPPIDPPCYEVGGGELVAAARSDR